MFLHNFYIIEYGTIILHTVSYTIFYLFKLDS